MRYFLKLVFETAKSKPSLTLGKSKCRTTPFKISPSYFLLYGMLTGNVRRSSLLWKLMTVMKGASSGLCKYYSLADGLSF